MDTMPGVDELLRQGLDAYRRLKLEQALAAYEQAESLDPASYDALVGQARTLNRMRHHKKATAVIERAIALDPNRFEAYAVQGVLNFVVDSLEESQKALEHALEIAPLDVETHLSLSQVYADLKRYDEAESELTLAHEYLLSDKDEVRHQELLAMAWHVESYLLLAKNRNNDAIEKAHRAIAMEEVNPYAACLAYSNVGLVELRAKHYKDALDYLEQGFLLNPYLTRVGAALGRALIIRGNSRHAVDILEKLLATPSEDDPTPTHYAYGMALARIGRGREAVEHYQLALQGNLRAPDKIYARVQLIWLNTWGRIAIIALALAITAGYLAIGGVTRTNVAFVVLLGMIVGLRWVWAKWKDRKR